MYCFINEIQTGYLPNENTAKQIGSGGYYVVKIVEAVFLEKKILYYINHHYKSPLSSLVVSVVVAVVRSGSKYSGLLRYLRHPSQ
jgi:hypothetical protein